MKNQFSRLLLYAVILAINSLFNLNAQSVNFLTFKNHPLAQKISPDLLMIANEYQTNKDLSNSSALFNNTEFESENILVIALCEGDKSQPLYDEMQRNNISYYKNIGLNGAVKMMIPIGAIEKMASLEKLKYLRLPIPHTNNTGSVTSQADVALRAVNARNNFGLDGNGITVGVLSDSYDALGGAAMDINTGDLPAMGVNVLSDIANGSDEGRGMLQLIHDLAPGADLAFHTAFNGPCNFADGILALQSTAGADVIVDDVTYFNEPFFNAGPIERAANQAVENGAVYFASAGNKGKDSYEGTNPFSTETFRFTVTNNQGQTSNFDYKFYDFDPSAGEDYFQAITVPANATIQISFQWDEPNFSSCPENQQSYNGSQNDLDIFILDSDAVTSSNGINTINGQIITLSADNNTSQNGNPVEIINSSLSNSSTTYYIAVGLFSGNAPSRIKYIVFEGIDSIDDFDTESATCMGHSNGEKVIAVGASAYFFTPAFTGNPPLLNFFSARGGIPVLFDDQGNSINQVIRNKPEITAVDGTNTTFFGSGDNEGDGFPNFFGTSAAAPHAAAVAALMLERQPTATHWEILAALQNSAIDITQTNTGAATGVGFDFDSGAGLIQADIAIDELDCFFAPRKVTLQTKVFLQGPYDGTAMETSLNQQSLIPEVEPYAGLNFTLVNNKVQEKTTSTIISSNDIVDWVFLELRDENDPSIIISTRSALLQADGDVVDMDGTSPVSFYCVDPGNYYVAVKHRNHLGVMTDEAKNIYQLDRI